MPAVISNRRLDGGAGPNGSASPFSFGIPDCGVDHLDFFLVFDLPRDLTG
jgi:hypothetical protein